ncbi:polysaccharide biosynthesis tyrosine autokinase [Cereibacter sphaeroides]|uniref:polysaccharide biosynthesis tyrosine autokinase n=1 Tax=Cereibacter sphaeroides TaxID=1063 RepID=UPI001F246CAB|nr:polysaccharide biosynthesis tyrosine autokinase [Cereibacter sphaeroides]MCE6949525.1 polysaccharide biosynthesis tyrosine autokinase [Cereibacter sphaeroides]
MTDGTRPVQAAEEDEIDLGQLLARLWAGKAWIAGSTAAAGLLALAHLANTPPTYRADALLQLEEKGAAQALPEAFSALAEVEPRSATEVEILRSRFVLGEAVAATHLDWQAAPLRAPVLGQALAAGRLPLPDLEALRAYDRGDARIRLDMLEVPPEWIGEEIRLTAAGEGRFTLALPDGSVAEGVVGVPLALPKLGFGLRIGVLDGAPGRQFVLRQQDETQVIKALRGRLAVAERGRDSSILEVSLTGSDPAEAQRTLAAIAEAYLQQNRSRSAAEAQSSLDFIEHQMPKAQDAVAAAEDRLNAYRRAQRAIDLGFEGQSLLTEIGTVETELRQLATEEEDLASRYTSNHPAYQKLLSARARLEERLAALRRETTELPETQREVFNLTRDLEVAQQVYLQLMNRAQELSVLKASTLGNVRLIDSARTEPQPIAPRRSRVLALALVLGGLAGAAGVLGRHWLRRGVRGAEELDRLGLPVFATVLFAPKMVRRRGDRRPLPILALTDPASASVEGLRSLRTSLHFGMLDARTRSIAITSAAPEAGKSFTAVNLAVVAAEAGQRVCLVDADLRCGQLRRYFGMSKGTPGLADYLAGDAALEDLLRPGPVEGLMVLTTGRYPPNPSELLMRPALAELVAELDRRFDLAIFDAPPALAVTDPVVIGRAVGATIAVVRHDVTPLGDVEALMRQLRSAGVKPAGAVLNAYRPEAGRGPYGYGYGYGYQYSYRPQAGE